jgi:hypothetical protein
MFAGSAATATFGRGDLGTCYRHSIVLRALDIEVYGELEGRTTGADGHILAQLGLNEPAEEDMRNASTSPSHVACNTRASSRPECSVASRRVVTRGTKLRIGSTVR